MLASLVAWSAWELSRRSPHPYRDLSQGHYTDHFSHLGSARLLPRVGLDLWRKPISELAQPLTPAERSRLPADVRVAAGPAGEVYSVPGWPAGKPLVASWSRNPRFYPPGDALLFAPIALLYHFSSLSFGGANLLALLLLLVFAHAALYLALRAQVAQGGLEPLVLIVVYFPIVHWTLEGFYDAAFLAPLIVCAALLQQRRGLHALLAFCSAAAIHFRALFFAPWALAALTLIVRERSWRSWRVREWLACAASAVLAAAALVPLALVRPALSRLDISNAVSLAREPLLRPSTLAFAIIALIGAGLLARARAYLDLAVLAWLSALLLSLRQAEEWHALALLPWLFAPVQGRSPQLVRAARLWLVLCLAALVFRETLAPVWLGKLLA